MQMTTTRKRLEQAAKKVTRVVGKAVVAAEAKVEKKIRQQRRRRAVRQAGEAALAAGAALLAGRTIKGAQTLIERRADVRRQALALGFRVTLPVDHERAIARLTDGLKAEGFGVLTRTDVQATLKEKLGVEFRPYSLIGVCNPTLAHRALLADPEAGLLLPCSVTVEEVSGGHTLVRVADPVQMLPAGELQRRPELVKIAHEARAGLARVVDTLAAHAGAVIL
jgi:uncharacterized protein (DUF302 family)